MPLYWVSAIVQDEPTQKPWLCAMTSGEPSLEKAKDTVNNLKSKHNLLSAWIDTFDENNIKSTVFHECYM